MSIRGNKVLSGTWGEIWVDGVPIIEFKKIEAKVSANREEVQMGIDIDSNIRNIRCESFSSYEKKKIIRAIHFKLPFF